MVGSLNFFVMLFIWQIIYFYLLLQAISYRSQAIQEQVEEYRASEDVVKRLKMSMVRICFRYYYKNNIVDKVQRLS